MMMVKAGLVRQGLCGVFVTALRRNAMELFKYRADILPEITYAGYHDIEFPYRNIRRVCEDYIFYLITDGEMYLEEDKNDFAAIRSLIERMLNRQTIHLENYNILSSCAVCEIFIELYRRSVMARLQNEEHGAEGSQRVNEVLIYLNSNYKRKLTGAILEKELSYNFDYLNQLFRKHLGISIFKMLENIRMEAARNILQTRALSIKYTANEVGYADETYFSKVFKKHTGSSPAKYRRKQR